MNTHQTTAQAAAAREHARRADGKFGTQAYDRADVRLTVAEQIAGPPGIPGAAGPREEAARPVRRRADDLDALHTMDGLRGHAMIPASAAGWPAMYSLEDVPLDEKPICARYFGPSSQEWLITEYDADTGEAFGRCDLGFGSSEWGYVDLVELGQVRHPRFRAIPAIERDLHFGTKTVGEHLGSRA